MKYKGAEITEMTPDQWDGKSREMLCWHVEPKSDDSNAFFKEIIVGYYNNHWHSHLGYRYEHCAEIFNNVGSIVYFWTATELYSINAYSRYFTRCESMASSFGNKTYYAYSVRLVKEV